MRFVNEAVAGAGRAVRTLAACSRPFIGHPADSSAVALAVGCWVNQGTSDLYLWLRAWSFSLSMTSRLELRMWSLHRPGICRLSMLEGRSGHARAAEARLLGVLAAGDP